MVLIGSCGKGAFIVSCSDPLLVLRFRLLIWLVHFT